jgi:cobalt-zinc-cadmium efflux system membrane fusion protein
MSARRTRARALATGLLALSCHRGAPDEPRRSDEVAVATIAAAHLDEPAHPGLPQKVRLPPDVIASAKIVTARAVREALAATLSLPGEVVADPDRSARVSSPVPGRLESVSFHEGSPVKKGALLALVRVPELGNVRSAHTAAGAKAKAARSNASRLEALLAQRLTSEQSYRDAVAQADALEAEALSLGDQLTGLGAGSGGGSAFLLALRAPIDGTVLSRDAVVGQPITPEKTLGSIADLGRVWFLGRIFEKDLAELSVGAATEVAVNAYPDRRFVGKVEYIGQQIDPAARTLTARIGLDNPEGVLRIGLFGTARVSKGPATGAPRLVVPRTALMEVAGKTVVFVRQPDGDFELHEVALGDAALGKVEIVTGLREGEDIVVQGAFTLKSAILRSTLSEEE